MPRRALDVLTVQKALAVSYHETRGRVAHPGTIDGIYGRWTAASLRSWMRESPQARTIGLTDFNVVEVADADGGVRHLNMDAGAVHAFIRMSLDYSGASHRRRIEAPPTTTSMPDPVTPAPPGTGGWYGAGSMDLDPEPPGMPPVGVPGAAAPLEESSTPFGPGMLPTMRRREEAPVWPWVAGGIAVAVVLGVVVWKSR